jgi:predicted dehydrogenase
VLSLIALSATTNPSGSCFLLEAFADAIEGKAPFPVRPEQMLDVIGAFEAIITSLDKGAPVKL